LEAEIINSYFKGMQMKHYFRPTGNMLKLMDGRVFKKNQKNLWEDVNSGVIINESQLQNFIASAAFTADPGGAPSGGKKKLTPIPEAEPAVTRLSGTFTDIVLNDTSEGQTNTLSFILGDADPTTPIAIRVINSGTFNGVDGFVYVYKNNTQIGILNATASSTVISSPTFITGDLIKFGAQTDSGQPFNFNVTVEIANRSYPQANIVLDTFNVSATFSA
jgi:hypothetical protein